MSQPLSVRIERRRQPRQTKAFAFWFRRPDGEQRSSGWMLDMSAGGAAFLTTPEEVPPVGERIELIEMQTSHPVVREDAAPLPPFARVLRHDDPEGALRRVAVRFETDARACPGQPEAQGAVAARPRPVCRSLVPPPLAALPGVTDHRWPCAAGRPGSYPRADRAGSTDPPADSAPIDPTRLLLAGAARAQLLDHHVFDGPGGRGKLQTELLAQSGLSVADTHRLRLAILNRPA